MPLKLWLPLDGTNENRGISGVTMSGSPASWGNGRTGKCAVFNNNAAQRITSSTAEFNYTVEDFSWCCWVNKDSSTLGTDRDMWAFTVGRADAGSLGYGLRVYQRSSGHSTIHVLFGSGKWGLTGIADGTWHHVAFTRKGSAIKVYLDGVLNTSADFTGTLPTYTECAGVGLGLFFYTGGNIYPLIGSISDFRIYNHTLSAKEVYELSRALIVHYPLSAPGNANPNLLTWTKNYTEASPFVWTSARADGSNYMGNDSLVTVTPGKDYYIQVKSTAIPGTHATGGTAVTNNFTLYLYRRDQGTSKAVGGYDAAVNLNKNNIFINDPERQLYVWKWTAPSNAQDITLRTNSYSDGTTAVTLKFWDFKIEEGTYTSYVPSKNSAQYGELGYGTGTVRDATGRGNDGQLYTSAPTFVSGSPRYSTCADFTGGSAIWPIPDPIKSDTQEFTIASWFKADDISSDKTIWTGRTTAGQAVSIFVHNAGFYIDDSTRTTISAGLTANTWYHVAVTWKAGGNKITYLNGAQISSVTAGTLAKTNSYGSIGRITVADAISGTGYMEGNISDFRIYGTSLTADDVKYLYETSAAIDNNGDMFADSFEETEMLPRVGKEGLVYGSHLSESGGTQRLFNNYTDMIPVDSNHSTKTFTPTTAQNSGITWYYFECIPGMRKYHITMVLEWGGFENITTDKPDFGAWFQGTARKTDRSGNEWTASSFTTALNNHKRPDTLAKANASGIYLYDIDFEMSSYYTDEYIGQHLGLRSDYSNGTGWFRISKVRIYPADEHMADTASLCASGAIQVRLADEVSLA